MSEIEPNQVLTVFVMIMRKFYCVIYIWLQSPDLTFTSGPNRKFKFNTFYRKIDRSFEYEINIFIIKDNPYLQNMIVTSSMIINLIEPDVHTNTVCLSQ